MSNFKNWQQFLAEKNIAPEENKGKNFKEPWIKPEEGLAGFDYDGPLSMKPAPNPGHGDTSKPNLYKNPGEVESGVVYVAPDDGEKKPLGQEATPGITAKTSSLGEPVTVKTKSDKPKKLTTEEFLKITKDMSNEEFANYILENRTDTQLTTVTDLYGNEFTPDPYQSIQYVAGLILGNPTHMGRLVNELKRRDGLNSLLEEVLDHNDSYKLIVNNLEDAEQGPSRCRRLARQMNDSYMSIFDKFSFGDDEEDDGPFGESVGPSIKDLFGSLDSGGSGEKKQGGSFGGGSGPDTTSDPAYKDKNKFSTDAGAESNPMGAQKAFGDFKTGGGLPMGGMTKPQFANSMPVKKMSSGDKYKYMGESAATNLINEMAEYPAFRHHMKKRCENC